MAQKEKMSEEKKIKLFYSGELLVIALIFLVFGILKVTGIMPGNEGFHNVFKWIAMFGGSWIVIDFVWAACSPKRAKRVCLLDKLLNLPAGVYLITFSAMAFGNMEERLSGFWTVGIGILFLYLCANYTFQAIYHWYHPIESLMESLKEDEKKE